MTVVGFMKQNWMLIVAGLLVVVAVFMIFQSMKKEKYYDYEMAGCSTCSAGDAGVFDNEEMYDMPDDYYGDDAGDEVLDDGTADATGDAEDDEYMYEESDAKDDDVTFAEEVKEADMMFAEEVKDGLDGEYDVEYDVDMLEIDELDAEEDDYSEL